MLKKINKYKFILILLIVIPLVFIVLNNQNNQSTLIGITGFTPINFPNSSENDIKEYFNEINTISNIYGINTNISSIGIIQLSNKFLSIPIVLVLDYKAVYESDKVINLIEENNIKYLGLGNEVNLLRSLDINEYNNFLTKYKEIYLKIKERFKDIKVFSVFQYEALIGGSMLSGNTYANSTDILNDFKGFSDIIVITLYPHLDYKTPNDIPQDYLRYLNGYTIGITETSWPSSVNVFSENMSDYNTNTVEQSEYINYLKNLKESYSIEFINWLYLNDLSNYANPLFKGSALKNLEGTDKLGFNEWRNFNTN